MNYKFNFSCDATRITLADFLNQGYGVWFDKTDGVCGRLNIGQNNTDSVVLLSKSYPYPFSNHPDTSLYRIKFDLSVERDAHAELIIPAQTDAVYNSDVHPLEETLIFTSLPNVVISDVVFIDNDDGYYTYSCKNEEQLVLDLLMASTEDIESTNIKPITEPWIDLYESIKAAADDYKEERHKEAIEFMRALINKHK